MLFQKTGFKLPILPYFEHNNSQIGLVVSMD